MILAGRVREAVRRWKLVYDYRLSIWPIRHTSPTYPNCYFDDEETTLRRWRELDLWIVAPLLPARFAHWIRSRAG